MTSRNTGLSWLCLTNERPTPAFARSARQTNSNFMTSSCCRSQASTAASRFGSSSSCASSSGSSFIGITPRISREQRCITFKSRARSAREPDALVGHHFACAAVIAARRSDFDQRLYSRNHCSTKDSETKLSSRIASSKRSRRYSASARQKCAVSPK